MTEVAVGTNLVVNPGFEELGDDGIPAGWQLALADPNLDKWAVDTELKSEGNQSIRFEPKRQCVLIQDVIKGNPEWDPEGKLVKVRVDARREGGAIPVLQLIAHAPNAPVNPNIGMGSTGMAQVVAQGPEGQFQTYRSEFEPTGPFAELKLIVTVGGAAGRVWFDNLVVELED